MEQANPKRRSWIRIVKPPWSEEAGRIDLVLWALGVGLSVSTLVFISLVLAYEHIFWK